MKFEIGKQYKTRGGWRAVILDMYESGMPVWHEKQPYTTVAHTIADGKRDFNRNTDNDNLTRKAMFDLIEEWAEPKVIKGWVNVYRDRKLKFHAKKEDADAFALNSRIACIPIECLEGEGL